MAAGVRERWVFNRIDDAVIELVIASVKRS